MAMVVECRLKGQPHTVTADAFRRFSANISLFLYLVVIDKAKIWPPSSTGRVAQRITRLTTDQKIAGSNPAVLEKSF